MYVACSDVYPQVEAGVRGYDRVIALRDTDNDGRADESKVFAEGLLIPTGMEVGPDRVYIGQGPELLTLRDTNGDGVADERTVLLTGFGNGDSHQTSNSFVWSPGESSGGARGTGSSPGWKPPSGSPRFSRPASIACDRMNCGSTLFSMTSWVPAIHGASRSMISGSRS